MSFPATIARAILDTVIGRLALLFLTGAAGDMGAARDAASEMLASHNAETPDQLSLAAEIISLQFQALEALSQASNPALPLNTVLRLRSAGAGLCRESLKAQRKLDQLQRARQSARRPSQSEQPSATVPGDQPPAGSRAPAATSQPAPSSPSIDKALDLVETVRNAMQTSGKTKPIKWSKAFQQRQTAKRIAENLKKNNPAPATQADSALAAT